MKKLFILLLSLMLMPVAFAYDAANIKININGAPNTNRYFLCLPNVGCLSILGAKKGKIYPVLNKVEVSRLYVVDARDNLRIHPQGLLPASCKVTVNQKQTITISANLTTGTNNKVTLNQLRCSVS
jgi:hypothetical protein